MSDGRISDEHPEGQHIGITCDKHPWLRWSTKNIGSMHEGRIFFARSLFFFSRWPLEECSCKASELRLVRPDDPDEAPITQADLNQWQPE